MKKCTLSPVQEHYVRKNYKTKFIYQMAEHLGTSEIFISRNMKVLGLVSPMRNKKTPIPDLTEQQEKFVVKHHKKHTVTEMARSMGLRFCDVNKFVLKHKLEVIKKKHRKYEPIEPDVEASRELRPPAQYSNTDYSRIYL